MGFGRVGMDGEMDCQILCIASFVTNKRAPGIYSFIRTLGDCHPHSTVLWSPEKNMSSQIQDETTTRVNATRERTMPTTRESHANFVNLGDIHPTESDKPDRRQTVCFNFCSGYT